MSSVSYADESGCAEMYRHKAKDGGKEGIALKISKKLDKPFHGMTIRQLMNYGGVTLVSGAVIGAVDAATSRASDRQTRQWNDISHIIKHAETGEDFEAWKDFRGDVYEVLKLDLPNLKEQDLEQPLVEAVRALDGPVTENKICAVKMKDGEPVIKHDKMHFKLATYDDLQKLVQEELKGKLAVGLFQTPQVGEKADYKVDDTKVYSPLGDDGFPGPRKAQAIKAMEEAERAGARDTNSNTSDDGVH